VATIAHKPTPTPVATIAYKPTPTPVATIAYKPTPTPVATIAYKPTPTPVATIAYKPTPTPVATIAYQSPTPVQTHSPTVRPSGKTTYYLFFTTYTVEGRALNHLTHQIEENRYRIEDNNALNALKNFFDKTGNMEFVKDPYDADIWIYCDVLPMQVMYVKFCVQDVRSGSFFYRGNAEMNRPYPGKEQQLIDISLKTIKNQFLSSFME
jgi:hypothetical protein